MSSMRNPNSTLTQSSSISDREFVEEFEKAASYMWKRYDGDTVDDDDGSIYSTPRNSEQKSTMRHFITNLRRYPDALEQQSPWSALEDDLLLHLRDENLSWEEVSFRLPHRTPKACEIRWKHYLNPVQTNLKQGRLFANKKDRVQRTLGNQEIGWENIAKDLREQIMTACLRSYKMHPSRSKRNRWTAEEYIMLLIFRDAGLSYQQIPRLMPNRARTACASPWNAITRLSQHSYQPSSQLNEKARPSYTRAKPKADPHSDCPNQYIPGRTPGVSQLRSQLGTASNSWQQHEVDTLVSLRRQGMSIREIYERLPNRTYKAVEGYYRLKREELGFEKMKGGRKRAHRGDTKKCILGPEQARLQALETNDVEIDVPLQTGDETSSADESDEDPELLDYQKMVFEAVGSPETESLTQQGAHDALESGRPSDSESEYSASLDSSSNEDSSIEDFTIPNTRFRSKRVLSTTREPPLLTTEQKRKRGAETTYFEEGSDENIDLITPGLANPKRVKRCPNSPVKEKNNDWLKAFEAWFR